MELFKYMKYRNGFFDNRLMRFTPLSILNDPFEGKVRDSSIVEHPLMRKGVMHIQENGKTVEVTQNNMADMLSKILDTLYDDLLVLSLSSSKHSLLMWVHYADSHKGIILGFDSDHKFFNQSIDLHSCGILVGNVYPVSYDRVRSDIIEIPKSVLHKSDEWMYEKEYRMFMTKKECAKSERDENGNEINLLEVPEEAITRVIIGANANRENIINEFRAASKKNKKLHHIKLEYGLPHKDLYHIEHHQVE